MDKHSAAAAICDGKYCTISYSTIVSSIKYLANVCLLASTYKNKMYFKINYIHVT